MQTDLSQVIHSSQTLTEGHQQYIIHQILRGLTYLHSASIIHRDIKPANRLVNKDCGLKICDFGLARVLTNEMLEVNLTEYVGTCSYRAPELIVSKDYTSAVDVSAVGCVHADMSNFKVSYSHTLGMVDTFTLSFFGRFFVIFLSFKFGLSFFCHFLVVYMLVVIFLSLFFLGHF